MCSEQIGRRAMTIVVVVLMMLTGCARDDEPAKPTPQSPPADPALVQTATGTVRGVVAPDHRLFAGIPYASPPIGPLRWQPPAPARPWPGVRDATRAGPRCMQDASDLEMGRQTSEDCLSLNVWTPPQSERKRAVMVWIHGGAFINGSSDTNRVCNAPKVRREAPS